MSNADVIKIIIAERCKFRELLTSNRQRAVPGKGSCQELGLIFSRCYDIQPIKKWRNGRFFFVGNAVKYLPEVSGTEFLGGDFNFHRLLIVFLSILENVSTAPTSSSCLLYTSDAADD